MKRTILVIEDDRDIAGLLRLHLGDAGFEVDVAEDGPGGLERALSSPYDLVLLDLMLPGLDGLDVCRRLRARNPRLPILILTSKSSELERVVGLEVGADDYLTKPFSVAELVARVKAILRRLDAMATPTEEEPSRPLVSGELVVDAARRHVSLAGKGVELTPKEFDLLLHFARHPGRVYTRAQLLDLVWGYSHQGYEHTVNSHINRLRAKIEADPSRPRYILTVWGVGYKFGDGDGAA